jgi:membrane-associated phospholipid phosphatase
MLLRRCDIAVQQSEQRAALLPPIFLFLLLVFITITVELNALKSIDEVIGFWIQRSITPTRTAVMLVWTNLGATWFVLLFTVVLGIVLAFRRLNYWLRRLVWSVPACMLSVEAIKYGFQRPRPVVPHPILQLATYSFPSGHTASATVLYGFLAILMCSFIQKWTSQVLIWSAAVALIVGVAFSRIYLGVHYVTDVTAGFILGLAWLSLSARLTQSREQHQAM